MKKLSSVVLLLALLVSYSCSGQQFKPPTPGAWITSDMLRTTDSIYYVLKYNNARPNGRYTITEVTLFIPPPDPTNDTSSPPLHMVQDRHSSGTFSKGMKTGLWSYYVGERKVREEQYSSGRRVSRRQCPCKK